MTLTIDIGNTNIVFGIADQNEWTKIWRIQTDWSKTADEYEVIFMSLLNNSQICMAEINRTVLRSVVPRLIRPFNEMLNHLLGHSPLLVEPSIYSKIPVKVLNPFEIGTDLVADAIAAFIRYDKPCMVIDFGTATTFNLISNGNYLGGLISIGIQTSLKALAQNTTLPLVNFKNIHELINNDTNSNIVAGAYYQNLFTVERIIREMKKEYKGLFVVATGGMSDLIMRKTGTIDIYEPNLVLDGLNLILELNVN